MKAAVSGEAGAERPVGIEKGLRVGLYFVLLLTACLYFEAALRVWALAWSWVRPAGRLRRFNTLIRQWGRVLCELTLRILKTEVQVVGAIPAGRFVVCSNHQSTADIAILVWVFSTKNCKYVAKRSLGRFLPSVSTALAYGGGALIDREPSRADLRRLKTMARSVEEWDGCPIVFPEGTRSRDGSLLPYFSAGLRIVAKESGLPILPVCIDGTHVASDLPGFARDMPGSKGIVTLGTPIPPEQYQGRIDEVLEEIRSWTEETMEEGRASGCLPRPRASLAATESTP